MASGGSATITTTVAVAPGYAGATPLVHSVTAAATSSDPDGADNVASASSAVDSSADLSVSVDGPSAAERGKTVEYSITVENLGPSDAEGVSLADPSPAGLTFVSNAGDCTAGFPCTLGTLPPGTTRTVTATFTVDKDAPDGPLTNAVTASATTPDPVASNNSASVTTGSGVTGCGCGQAPGAAPAFLLALGLVALARRRRTAQH